MELFFIMIIVAVTILGPLGVLVLYGIIGPASLRSRMKRFLNFFDHDDPAMLFPYDHTKPSTEALKEMTKSWSRAVQRQRGASRPLRWYILITLLGIVMFILVAVLAAHPDH
jgi:hypothetical protein